MTGSSIFDYIHRADYEELADQFGLNTSIPTASRSYNSSLSSSDSEEQEDGGRRGEVEGVEEENKDSLHFRGAESFTLQDGGGVG